MKLLVLVILVLLIPQLAVAKPSGEFQLYQQQLNKVSGRIEDMDSPIQLMSPERSEKYDSILNEFELSVDDVKERLMMAELILSHKNSAPKDKIELAKDELASVKEDLNQLDYQSSLVAKKLNSEISY